jgi:hypothetical protein
LYGVPISLTFLRLHYSIKVSKGHLAANLLASSLIN